MTLAQHHGLPTRLLDWTESALAALYFAVEQSYSGADGCVWILNPGKLNRTAGIDHAVIVLGAAIGPLDGYLRPCTSSQPVGRDDVLAVRPAHVAPRVTAQRGVFTLFGDLPQFLDEIVVNETEDILVRIGIPSNVFPQLRDELTTAGISASTLYPDIDGLAREIKGELLRTVGPTPLLGSIRNMPEALVLLRETFRANAQMVATLSRAADSTSADALREAVEKVTQQMVMIDISSSDPNYSLPLGIEVGQNTSASDFLGQVYSLISDSVPAFTYGLRWYLKEKDGPALSIEMGSTYSQALHGDRTVLDHRPIRKLGIKPGMNLEVVLLPKNAKGS